MVPADSMVAPEPPTALLTISQKRAFEIAT
jgi:hypothetical protein